MTETLDHKLATLKLGRMRQVYASWPVVSFCPKRYHVPDN